MKKEFTHVYTAKIPDSAFDICTVYPPLRRAYVESAKNVGVRRARYYVWRLLAVALDMSLGIDIKSLDFTSEGGKWCTSACHISLSHGGGYVAVALSNAPVGVDIEPIAPPRSERFAKRILTNAEMKEYTVTEESARKSYLTRAWSKKEAIFKSMDKESFMPQKIDTGAYLCKTRTLSYPEGELILAVAHGEGVQPEIYENTEI